MPQGKDKEKGAKKIMNGIKTTEIGAYEPENRDEANGEIMGRCNALHDYLLDLARQNAASAWRSEPLDSDLRTVCLIMGFADALNVEKVKPETENASATNTGESDE